MFLRMVELGQPVYILLQVLGMDEQSQVEEIPYRLCSPSIASFKDCETCGMEVLHTEHRNIA